jgi:hypothetical protein
LAKYISDISHVADTDELEAGEVISCQVYKLYLVSILCIALLLILSRCYVKLQYLWMFMFRKQRK